MYEKEKEILKSKTKFTTEDLLLIIKILRGKDGCPWDAEQTHKSIIPGLIEETYETVEAIEMESPEMLCEELGDVLLQIVFHSDISSDEGDFNYTDVVSGVCRKMIVRHPHVFGDVQVENSAEVLKNWDKIKADTKSQSGLYEKLCSVAKPLPALMRAQKLIHKAAKENIKPSENLLKGAEGEAANALLEAIYKCEELDLSAETVLRHLSEAFIEQVKDK